jgi:hypothetical protein
MRSGLYCADADNRTFLPWSGERVFLFLPPLKSQTSERHTVCDFQTFGLSDFPTCRP